MKIQSLGMAALFTAVGVSYIWWPFQGFDVQDALVSSPSAAFAVDSIADSPIDVRPPFNVKIFRLL